MSPIVWYYFRLSDHSVNKSTLPTEPKPTLSTFSTLLTSDLKRSQRSSRDLVEFWMYHLFGPIFVLVLLQISLYMVFVTLHMKMTSWQSGIFFGRIGIRWNILLWRPHQVPTVHSPYPPLSSSQAASSSSTRVAEVVRGHGGPRQKVWTRTKIFRPNLRYFVAN